LILRLNLSLEKKVALIITTHSNVSRPYGKKKKGRKLPGINIMLARIKNQATFSIFCEFLQRPPPCIFLRNYFSAIFQQSQITYI
jgi:hypothetical protein